MVAEIRWHPPLAPLVRSVSRQLEPLQKAWTQLPMMWLVLWLLGFAVIFVLSMTVFIVIPGCCVVPTTFWTSAVLRMSGVEGAKTPAAVVPAAETSSKPRHSRWPFVFLTAKLAVAVVGSGLSVVASKQLLQGARTIELALWLTFLHFFTHVAVLQFGGVRCLRSDCSTLNAELVDLRLLLFVLQRGRRCSLCGGCRGVIICGYLCSAWSRLRWRCNLWRPL